jgi:copper chaperone CopZ
VTTIRISGMSCAHCTGSVTKALNAIPGVSNVQVSLTPGQATFDAAPDVDLDAVAQTIRNLGFEVEE